MAQTPSDFLHAAFDQFREITRGLRDLDPDAQVPFLKYELLQALERASDLVERHRELERKLEELRAGGTSVQLSLAAGEATDLGSWKSTYEERLQIAEAAYRVMKRRCASLEERCQGLLATIERAAFGDGPGDSVSAPTGRILCADVPCSAVAAGEGCEARTVPDGLVGVPLGE